MNLRGIVAVSGRPGLYKLVGQKVKIVANITTTKLASLEDITIYGEDEDLKLVDVLANIVAANGTVPDAKSDAKALKSFFEEVAPNHDQEKVYSSDMKKIITWYHLLKDLPLFTDTAEVAEGDTEGVKTDEKVEKKIKATPKPSNAKAPAKTAQPAKKASMTSKKGV
jgi:hypothetical protein